MPKPRPVLALSRTVLAAAAWLIAGLAAPSYAEGSTATRRSPSSSIFIAFFTLRHVTRRDGVPARMSIVGHELFDFAVPSMPAISLRLPRYSFF